MIDKTSTGWTCSHPVIRGCSFA